MSRCPICGCAIHREGEYATPTIQGRSHATAHHFVAQRFLYRRSRDLRPIEPIFKRTPWPTDRKSDDFCYECHEELLHNPVLLPDDIRGFAELVRLRGLKEVKKPKKRDKIARRIMLLHQVIEAGIKALLKTEKIKRRTEATK